MDSRAEVPACPAMPSAEHVSGVRSSVSSTVSSVTSSVKQTVKEVEKVTKGHGEKLSNHIWKPASITFAYIWALRAFSNQWRQELTVFTECSWVTPAVATSLYLAFIVFGQRMMKDRQPMQLLNYMFTYNLYQTILNVWSVGALLHEVYSQGYPLWGNRVGETSYQLGFIVYVHYQNKYVELADTVFMILRKKDRQVSFLHVFHHCLLIWAWFLVCRFAPSGDAYFGALMNSGIHVMMYAHYALTLVGVPSPWKRRLTQAQLTQFVVCLVHVLYVFYLDIYPRWLCCVEIFVMVTMLILFANFYKQNYKAAAARKLAASNKAVKAE